MLAGVLGLVWVSGPLEACVLGRGADPFHSSVSVSFTPALTTLPPTPSRSCVITSQFSILILLNISAAFDLVTYTLLSKTLSTPACWDTRVSFSSYVSLHPACRGFPWLSPKGPFSSDAMPSPWSDLTRGPWPLIASRHRGSLVCLSYRPPPSLDFFLLLRFLTVTSLFACLAVSGLSWGPQRLRCITWGLFLCHVDSSCGTRAPG